MALSDDGFQSWRRRTSRGRVPRRQSTGIGENHRATGRMRGTSPPGNDGIAVGHGLVLLLDTGKFMDRDEEFLDSYRILKADRFA